MDDVFNNTKGIAELSGDPFGATSGGLTTPL